jgi:hypothetical protein
MPEIEVTIFRHRARPDEFAVSPDLNGRFLREFFRQQTISTDTGLPGSEIAAWLEAFERDGYRLLLPGGPRFTEIEGISDPRSPLRHAYVAALRLLLAICLCPRRKIHAGIRLLG